MFATVLLMSPPAVASPEPTAHPTLERMRETVMRASALSSRWEGPQTGPAAQAGKRIAVICEDLRNGGVLGVARGVEEAAQVVAWEVRLFVAHGTPRGRRQAIDAALAMDPDGVILIGSDARSLDARLAAFSRRNIPVVGWHVGATAGVRASEHVAINVSTDPLEVARITAMAAIVSSPEPLGVVIFTDPSFNIAMRKADAMAGLIRDCQGCTLLAVRPIPISSSAQTMAKETRELLARYGASWTHALAINDIYFDYATPELTKAGRDVQLFSAGDGSSGAFLRIQAGTFQRGTVAEPLNLQGWQLVDELNRLLSGEPISGYVPPFQLVTPENVDAGPQLFFDPDNGYRQAYRRIWQR
ncbi:substrate-binding domain-containing protein [Denitromonas sp. IR12]|uniref:Substrate-binding domain-containing protein n=2 Tax=Denitromonas iodatirespirans TaxID=2795389 RepID=A0A944DFI5_DENI1|nr:substrate-binding domain-containing protein [Denitromonas iodatirespirans]